MTGTNVTRQDGNIRVEMGDVKLARAGEQLSVFLGSCVSIILWHAATRTAVMSHILLPYQPFTPVDGNEALFAGGAWRLMQSRLASEDIALSECLCHVVGAAEFVDGMNSGMGRVILHEVQALINAKGMVISNAHVGGSGYHAFRFDAASGCLHVQQHAASPTCGDITYGAFPRPLLTPKLGETLATPGCCGRRSNPATSFLPRSEAS